MKCRLLMRLSRILICGHSPVGRLACGPPDFRILLPYQISSQYLLRLKSSGSDTITIRNRAESTLDQNESLISNQQFIKRAQPNRTTSSKVPEF
jgi:hypothetical protein